MKKYRAIFKIFSLAVFAFLANFGVAGATTPSTGAAPAAPLPSLDWWDKLQMAIADAIVSLCAKVLEMAGALFNYSLKFTINMNEVVENTGVVDIGWTTVRNISNMGFIFILLAISIATILGIQSYNAKNLLKNVILVALLINFSLFATNVIIDSSNMLALGFYDALVSQDSEKYDRGISAMFAQNLKLHTIYDADKLAAENATDVKLTPKNLWTICLFGSVFLLVTAFVFFASAILFIIRIVVLMFLMILSPLAFLCMVLPATRGYAKEWWTTLFKQSFFAPLYLMFIYIVAMGINSTAFKKTIGVAGGDNNFASVITGAYGGGTSYVVFNFILIIGLMIASLVAAKKMGAMGATSMVSWGQGLKGWGQKMAGVGVGAATFGVGGRLARRYIGGGAQKRADAEGVGSLQDRASQGGMGGAWARLQLKTMRGMGDASFDARNTGLGKKLPLGSGTAGGYKTKRDKRIKEQIAFGKSLKGDTGRMRATGRFHPVTGAPIWRAESRTEAYGGTLQDRTIMGTVMGATVANRKAGDNLVKEFTYKRDLKEAKKDLKAANDKLTDLRKVVPMTPIATADIDAQRIVISDVEDKVNDLNEKIKKLTATTPKATT